jgi:hypothetical protein
MISPFRLPADTKAGKETGHRLVLPVGSCAFVLGL